MTIGIVLGTRPEIVKLAPILWELHRRKKPYKIVHSGQHYDYNLSRVFFEQLKIREPDVYLNVGSGSDAEQTAKIILGMQNAIHAHELAKIVVEGDTNTVLGGAIAAKKQGKLLYHVEAGARAYDRSMPEEVNRVVCDHLSDVLFAASRHHERNLLKEGIGHERIVYSGNTAPETYRVMRKHARPPAFGHPPEFALVTVHRQENQNPTRLRALVNLLEGLEVPALFVVHPRTRKSLEAHGLWTRVSESPNILAKEPVGYEEMLYLLERCAFVLTDSGGLQEEAAVAGKPVAIPRDRTEWVEIVESGAGALIDLDGKSGGKLKRFLAGFKPKRPFPVENASRRIVDRLLR